MSGDKEKKKVIGTPDSYEVDGYPRSKEATYYV